jgi:hypothetical protein
MVERPIKKSERQANPDASSSSPPPREDRKERSARGKDKGKGKRGSRDEEPKQAVNPAFARPPKPSNAKPPVIEEVAPEPTEDSSRSEITGEVSEETAEAVTE